MYKNSRLLTIMPALVLLSTCVFAAQVFAVQGAKKIALISSCWGQKGIPQDILDVAQKYPKARFAFAWQSNMKVSENMFSLVNNSSIEPVLALQFEPAMPLVNGLNISTPAAVSFSWPDDIWQAVFNAQQEYRSVWAAESSGLYLRSGLVDRPVADGLNKLGINWTNVSADLPDGRGDGRQITKYGEMLIFSDTHADASDVGKFINYISSPNGQSDYVLFFTPTNPLTRDFLAALALRIETDPGIELVLPREIVKAGYVNIPEVDWASLTPDVSPWLKNPAVWQRLQTARKAIEDYKNSGQAQVSVLEAAREEITSLYSYDFLKKLNESSGGSEEQYFQAGLMNIYRLIKKPLPAEMTEPLTVQRPEFQARSFSLISSSDKVILNNSTEPGTLYGISTFEISASVKGITYKVTLSSDIPVGTETVVDIYIDMNNKRDAGLTKAIPGIEAYLKPQDAWEFAVRVENGEASLFRSGRLVPGLVKKYRLLQNNEFEIPRSVLRGDPMKWGYQVMLMTRRDPQAVLTIEDFLCPENLRSEKLLQKVPVELPALRFSR